MFKNKPNLSLLDQMIIALPDVIVEKHNEATDPFLVLMCDGIWNSMTNEEVIEYVAKNIKSKSLAKMTEEIIEKVLPKVMPPSGIKGKDNMTFMIVKLRPTVAGHKTTESFNASNTALSKTRGK